MSKYYFYELEVNGWLIKQCNKHLVDLNIEQAIYHAIVNPLLGLGEHLAIIPVNIALKEILNTCVYIPTSLGKPRPIRTSSCVVYGICRGLPSDTYIYFIINSPWRGDRVLHLTWLFIQDCCIGSSLRAQNWHGYSW